MTLPDSLMLLTGQSRRVPLDMIRESVVTLRSDYDEDALRELGNSLGSSGQHQPIVVQPGEGDYVDLVIGSRRLRAARARGLPDLVAFFIDKHNPLDLLLMALAENLHREDLNPFEEAQAFLRLMKEYELDLKTIATKVNKNEQYVRRRIELLSMPDQVKTLIAEKKLPLQHVAVLARLGSGEEQVGQAQQAVKHRLTASELRARIKQERDEPASPMRSTYELTAEKVRARLEEFTEWLQKVPRRMNFRKMNGSEKTFVLRSIQSLEDEVRSLRANISGVEVSSILSDVNLTRSHTDPSNHGQEWTINDIRRINSLRRPSDQELAAQLGRTVGAIAEMRAKTKEKKRRQPA